MPSPIGIIPILVALALPAAAGDVGNRIAQAEKAEAAGRFDEALGIYREILEGNEGSVEWRMARVCSDKGELAPEAERAAIFDEAVGHARRAVKAAPRSADAHAMLAVALGRKALYAGTKEAVEISREVKSSADRAVALDRECFLGYLVLGIWHREIAGLGFFERAAAKILYGGVPEASFEASARNLERAVKLRPDSVRADYELAVTYWKLGEKTKARDAMRRAAEMTGVRAGDVRYRQKARELLEKFGG